MDNNINNLPDELKIEILSYLKICKFDKGKYIFNKSMLKIYQQQTKDCKHINILKKNVCYNCYKKEIDSLRFLQYYKLF